MSMRQRGRISLFKQRKIKQFWRKQKKMSFTIVIFVTEFSNLDEFMKKYILTVLLALGLGHTLHIVAGPADL